MIEDAVIVCCELVWTVEQSENQFDSHTTLFQNIQDINLLSIKQIPYLFVAIQFLMNNVFLKK